MTQEEIKQLVDMNLKSLAATKETIEIIRSICKHPKTFKGKYEYRVGMIHDAIICSDCGELIEYAIK